MASHDTARPWPSHDGGVVPPGGRGRRSEPPVKVVLFCGGLGTRLREHSETIPKPMVNIGYRPIIWHLMKYYSYFGHNDFILCLGYRGDVIKQYFLNYDECMSNDIQLTAGGKSVTRYGRYTENWTSTFPDPALH